MNPKNHQEAPDQRYWQRAARAAWHRTRDALDFPHHLSLIVLGCAYAVIVAWKFKTGGLDAVVAEVETYAIPVSLFCATYLVGFVYFLARAPIEMERELRDQAAEQHSQLRSQIAAATAEVERERAARHRLETSRPQLRIEAFVRREAIWPGLEPPSPSAARAMDRDELQRAEREQPFMACVRVHNETTPGGGAVARGVVVQVECFSQHREKIWQGRAPWIERKRVIDALPTYHVYSFYNATGGADIGLGDNRESGVAVSYSENEAYFLNAEAVQDYRWCRPGNEFRTTLPVALCIRAITVGCEVKAWIVLHRRSDGKLELEPQNGDPFE